MRRVTCTDSHAFLYFRFNTSLTPFLLESRGEFIIVEIMKKQLLSFVALLCVVWLTPARALAYDFEVDGIYYSKIVPSDTPSVKVTTNGYYSGSYTGAITIPETVTYKDETYSVTSIGDWAFASSSALTSIVIPANVSSIGDYAFVGCSGLTSIVVAAGNLIFDSRENCNAIIETSTNTLIQGCNTTIIPNSVTSIRDYAFEYCSGLTSIEIPNSVTSIGGGVFLYCSGLTSIVVEPGNPIFDSRESCNAIIRTSDNLLIIGIKTTVIPNSVTSIAIDAFRNCSGLTSIEIPSSVTDIGNYAFYNCGGVTKVISRAIVPPTCRLYTWLGDGLGDEEGNTAVTNSTLYVPAGTKDAYAAAEGWRYFRVIEEFDATEITTLDAEATDSDLSDCEIYTAGGQRVDELQAGANIVRMKNGKVKKIVKR